MGIVFIAKAQIFTVQIGHVVFNSDAKDTDSSIEKEYSILCDRYVKKYYANRKIPLIYLEVGAKKDTIVYGLAYDNLRGNSTLNKDYGWKGKYYQYYQPGIRITLYSKKDDPEDLLKFLDYGINHLRELKKIRHRALKMDYYDQPHNLSIDSQEINQIIDTPSSGKIITIVNQLKKPS